ncbi:MAG: hypothetical protein AB7K71_18380 [Polyangiaceae bacterium]
MKKLPAAAKLAAQVLATSVGKGRTLADSASFLTSKSRELQKYQGIEHLVTASVDDQLRKAVEHHMVLVRAQIARELWGRQLFIGVSVLDDLLFRAIVDGSSNPVLRTLELIRDNELHHPGFVVFPVHSFGLLGAGALHFFTKARIEFTSSAFGLVLSPQTNSLTATIALLDRAREAFGIRKAVPSGLLRHWFRSRSATWLTRNPLLIVKTQSFPGEYYENQFLLVSKLRQVTTLVSMLAALQPTVDERKESVWSSSTFNNFQTLDIRHYLVLFNSPSSRHELKGDCVPMHLRAPALAELSDLGIELDPRHWRRRKSLADRVYSAVNTVHDGYLRYSFGAQKEGVHGRVYRKLFEAMAFFRRSFQRTDMDWSAVVSLAVSFEMLLTDGYAQNVKARLLRRTRKLLRGVAGVRAYTKAVEDLYSARGAIVHAGSTQQSVDLQIARRAFVHAFVVMVEALPNLSATSQAPMKDLSGDAGA